MKSILPNIRIAILSEMQKHGCHTIILYGSRARGDYKDNSDYDVLGLHDKGEAFRDARKWNGAYLDAFIWPVHKIASPDESMIYMRDGVVLIEKESLGTEFLKKLNAIVEAGPKKLPQDEIEARKIWAVKMLERAKSDDLEAHYRRAWLMTSLLEDYFLIRAKWYLGSKQSLEWLRVHDPKVYTAFEAALKPHSALRELEILVALVINETEN